MAFQLASSDDPGPEGDLLPIPELDGFDEDGADGDDDGCTDGADLIAMPVLQIDEGTDEAAAADELAAVGGFETDGWSEDLGAPNSDDTGEDEAAGMADATDAWQGGGWLDEEVDHDPELGVVEETLSLQVGPEIEADAEGEEGELGSLLQLADPAASDPLWKEDGAPDEDSVGPQEDWEADWQTAWEEEPDA